VINLPPMTETLPFRVVFMGTPGFALPSLQALVDGGFEVVGVYSQPPRPKGRGYEVTLSPVHELALSLGLPVFTPPSLRTPEAQEELKALAPQVIVVAAYGLILPQSVLDIPSHGCINVHGSLLPRWRGAAPIQRALLTGDAQTGVAIMHMEAGLDTGPVYEMASCAITDQDTAPSLQDKLSSLGAHTLVKVLRQVHAETCPSPTPQPEEGVTYAHKLTHEEGIIQWSDTAQEIDRALRALNPWPGTFTYHGKDRLKILEAVVEAPEHLISLSPCHPGHRSGTSPNQEIPGQAWDDKTHSHPELDSGSRGAMRSRGDARDDKTHSHPELDSGSPGPMRSRGDARDDSEGRNDSGGCTELPGTLLDGQLLVACGTGALRITRLQKQGGKPLAAKDFLNGHPLPQGSILTPHVPL
jgi:methionyl-tRNA formyltransferase